MSLHSEDYFGSERDFWWNEDFLALIAKRVALGDKLRVLDVGCGVGHWTRALLPHLPLQASVIGVDREGHWVDAATDWARRSGLAARISFRHGTVEQLPFPDNEFDLVTCQTLLIHVPDVAAALAEMLRVLVPKGTLLVAEPNNLASSLVATNTNFDQFEARLTLARFQALCEHGKAMLGEGHNSIGDLLPGLIAQAGFCNVRAWISDRASLLIPPYADAAQRATVEQTTSFATREMWIWNREDTSRYFLAGGGSALDFEKTWRLAVEMSIKMAADLREGKLDTAGGQLTYVISADKGG